MLSMTCILFQIFAFTTGVMYIVIAVVIIMEGVATDMFKTEVVGPISLIPTQITVQKDQQETYSQQSPLVETEGTSRVPGK